MSSPPLADVYLPYVGLYLLSWWLQVAVLCLVAAVTARIARSRSSGFAHRIWISALVGVCLLPIVSLLSPGWGLRFSALTVSTSAPAIATDGLLAADHDFQTVSADIPTKLSAVSKSTVGSPDPGPALPARDHESSSAENVLHAPVSLFETPPSAEPEATTLSQVDWISVFIVVWVLVAVVFLFQLMVAFLKLARFIRRAPAASPALQTLVEEIARALQIRLLIELRLLGSGAMPMACWWGRSVVLLPEDIVNWPADERRTVIAHELGHVMRRDAWSDLLTQLVWRCLWIHPLLWLACRMIPGLRERACDEWVLQSGQVSAHDYARHLLAVVARCSQPAHALSPAMARGPELEWRVRGILETKTAPWSRRPMARTSVVIAFLLLTGMLGGGRLLPASATLLEGGDQTNGLHVADEPVAADEPTISAAGIVVTPEGKPIPNATVILRAETASVYTMGVKHAREVLARMRTDAQGSFEFENVGIPWRHESQIRQLLQNDGGATLLAWADGKALAWTTVKGLNPKAPFRLVLEPEARVTGSIRDSKGRPLEGVSVKFAGVTRATDTRHQLLVGNGELQLFFMQGSPDAVVTDKAGTFSVPHSPPNRSILLQIEKNGLTRKSVVVDTGEVQGPAETRKNSNQTTAMPVLRSPLDLSLEPAFSVTIRVLDQAGLPVDDGCIMVMGSDNTKLAAWVEVADHGEAGANLARPGVYHFTYISDPLKPRLGVTRSLETKAGQSPQLVELQLPASKWLSGKVVNADTGTGVAGANITYGNNHDPKKLDMAQRAATVSARDGSFRIPVAPGKGSVGYAHPFGYFPSAPDKTSQGKAMQQMQIEVAGEGEPPAITLPMGRGLAIRGSVSKADGKPAPGLTVSAFMADNRFQRSAVTDAAGRFELVGLSPYHGASLIVSGPGGSARAKLEATPGQFLGGTLWKNVDLRLDKGGVVLTGRVMHQGKARAGVAMKLKHTIGAALPLESNPNRPGTTSDPNCLFPVGEVVTDDQGRYRISGVSAGQRYLFEVKDSDGMRDLNWPYQDDGLHVYVQTVPKNQAEVQLPDVNLVASGQTLRGEVVDPKGKPVAGAKISASLANGELIPRRQHNTPWTDTDAQGRFVLTDLPNLPIELLAYVHNPGEEYIRYTVKTRPTLNQTNVRIILDPSLHTPIESLDEPKKQEVSRQRPE
jgi:beta-lactamase regulating signal transducer with metallopeptidase domain